MKNTISATQTGMLVVFLVLANKIIALPSLIFEIAGADGFFVSVLIFAVDILSLLIFFWLKFCFPTQSFRQILEHFFGKFVAKIILIVLATYFLFKITLVYSVAYMFLKQQVYQDEFSLLALLAIIPIACHGVLVGLRPFARSVQILFYITIAGFVACLAIGAIGFRGAPVFFSAQPQQFFSGCFRHLFAFGDYILLFLFIDKIQLRARQRKQVLLFAILGIFLVLSLMFLFYSSYHYTAFMHNSALDDIISISIRFSTLGRLDIIAMFVVMFLSYIQITAFLHGFSIAFCEIFPKLSPPYSIASFVLLFILVYYVLIGKYEIMIDSATSFLPFLALIVGYILPLLLAVRLVCANVSAQKRKRRRKIEDLS